MVVVLGEMGSKDELKSEALLEQMKQHLNTDAGKAIVKKIGLVYQINIAPKVKFNPSIKGLSIKRSV